VSRLLSCGIVWRYFNTPRRLLALGVWVAVVVGASIATGALRWGLITVMFAVLIAVMIYGFFFASREPDDQSG
jgi:hypothetical protein